MERITEQHAHRLAAAGILLAALTIRLLHLNSGLPDFTDEAKPFRTALEMWRAQGGAKGDPGFYVYPSLTIYLNLLLQGVQFAVSGWFGVRAPDLMLSFATDPSALVVPARAMLVVIDVLCVAGTISLGERIRRGAGLLAGGVIALSPMFVQTSRAMYVETTMAALAVWSLERFAAFVRKPSARHWIVACVLAGLAASAKYPGALLALSLAACGLMTPGAGRERLRWTGLGLFVMAGAFAITSPYIFLSWNVARHDLGFIMDLARTGTLGVLEGPAAVYYAGEWLRNFGPAMFVGFVACVAGWPAASRPIPWIVGAFAVPYAVAIAASHASVQRYLVPLAPGLLVLGAAVLIEAVARLPVRRRAMAAVAIALVCTIPWVPAAWRGLRVTSSTRSLAVRWLEANLPADAAVLTEAQGPPLRSHRTIEDLRSSEWYAVASAAARDRVDRARGWNVVTLPLFVEGSLDLIGSLPDGRPIRAVVIPEAADLSKVFYVPRLLAGADVIITSSAVRGRYEQAVPRFERQVAAYRVLDRWMPAVEFRAPFGSDQPTIRIYRLADGARAEFESMEPELDPAWWMEAVPADTWSALLERNAFPTDAGRIFFADHMDPFLRAWGAAVRGRPLAREIERVRAFWSSPAR